MEECFAWLEWPNVESAGHVHIYVCIFYCLCANLRVLLYEFAICDLFSIAGKFIFALGHPLRATSNCDFVDEYSLYLRKSISGIPHGNFKIRFCIQHCRNGNNL